MTSRGDPVEAMVAGGRLERVAADPRLARRLLDDAGRHLTTAAVAARAGDPAGAYQLAYDALRKSAAALLGSRALRATSRGGHVAVQDAVIAHFGKEIPQMRAFSRIRRARNGFEYPDSDGGGPSPEDVEDAIAIATAVRVAAEMIIETMGGGAA